jgi:hypothetical protein
MGRNGNGQLKKNMEKKRSLEEKNGKDLEEKKRVVVELYH